MKSKAKAIVSGVLALSLSFIVATASEKPSPNIIVILVDDMGWGDLGCYPKGKGWGEEAHMATPNIDRLAASGARLTDAYATFMACAPSRAALLSGRYQQRFGYYGFEETAASIPKDLTLLPEALRSAGYLTVMAGKWHVSECDDSRPMKRGFDHFFGIPGGQHDYYDARIGQPYQNAAKDNTTNAVVTDDGKPVAKIKYLTDELTDRSIAMLKRAKKQEKPFFLYLSYTTPHPPLQAKWEDLAPFVAKRSQGQITSRDIVRAMIVSLDANIGRLTHWLRENGLTDDTLIFFTSDNGGHDDGPGHVVQHNGGLRGRKGYFYEGGIREPFIVTWPGRVPTNTVYRQPVSHLDIYPTVLAAAGVSSAQHLKNLDGVNLLPYLNGSDTNAPHQRLFWSTASEQIKWAVREGDWKLVNEDMAPTINNHRGATQTPEFRTQLFNLKSDPFEQRDLSADYPDRVASLSRAMKEFHASMRPSLFTPRVQAALAAKNAEQKKNTELEYIPRVDGAPGHWIGEGAKARMADEVVGNSDYP